MILEILLLDLDVNCMGFSGFEILEDLDELLDDLLDV